MAERPIIFSGPMVRAILEGRKTQTRRVVKPQPVGPVAAGDKVDLPGVGCIPMTAGDIYWEYRTGLGIVTSNPNKPNGEMLANCPYGSPGDVLWVRETWSHVKFECGDGAVKPGNFNPDYPWEIRYRADGGEPAGGRWRSPIHMPKWACRLRLRVVDVRVERVQEIDAHDAKWEGMVAGPGSRDQQQSWEEEIIQEFRCGWDEMHAKRGFSWDVNPWVFVVEFEHCAAGGP